MNNVLLSQYLIESGIIDEEQLQLVLDSAPDRPVTQVLEEMNVATEVRVYTELSNYLGLRYIDLDDHSPTLQALNLLPADMLQKYKIVPIAANDANLEIATACPGDSDVLEEIQFITNRTITEHLARPAQIIETLENLIISGDNGEYASEEVKLGRRDAGRNLESELPHVIGDATSILAHLEFDDMEDSGSAVRILNRMLKNAIHRNVSDMHVEPRKGRLVIRVRIDGELSELCQLPAMVGHAVISRLKVLAEMDITESSRPQDGSFTVKTGDRKFDLRVSSVPTPYGEKIVIRLLDPDQGKVKLESLGLLTDAREKLDSLTAQSQGMIIITGPTGSGKSTTLCSAINSIKSMVSNIVSVEDPIEYEIEGVNQISVNTKRGITFATVLRALLRQDPNVIYIGEIRDEETAKIACQAAQTGHLVFSTLHTNDAGSAVTRLLNFGVDRFALADALTGVVAQRLSRRVCPDCGTLATPHKSIMDELSNLSADITPRPMEGKGCKNCNNTGFKGRVAVTELLVVDADIKKMIIENRSAGEISKKARSSGMKCMWETGLQLAALGMTTYPELCRHVPKSEVAKKKKEFPSRILVVDDEPSILKLCQKTFKDVETEIVTASDGDYALEAIRKQNPDFVITDLNMPRMDGYTLCRKIRQDPSTAGLPIIVMTGKGSLEEAECSSFEIGATDFISKPIKPTALLTRVRVAYRRHQAAASRRE